MKPLWGHLTHQGCSVTAPPNEQLVGKQAAEVGLPVLHLLVLVVGQQEVLIEAAVGRVSR